MAQSQPRPRTPIERPNYPRLSALAIATALAACGGEVQGSSENGPSASDDSMSSPAGGDENALSKDSAKTRDPSFSVGGAENDSSHDQAETVGGKIGHSSGTGPSSYRTTGGTTAQLAVGGAADQPQTEANISAGGVVTSQSEPKAQGGSAKSSTGGSHGSSVGTSVPQLSGGAPLPYVPLAGGPGLPTAGGANVSGSTAHAGGVAGLSSTRTAQGSTGGGTSAPSFVASGGRTG